MGKDIRGGEVGQERGGGGSGHEREGRTGDTQEDKSWGAVEQG
jgi:hypothetical protein